MGRKIASASKAQLPLGTFQMAVEVQPVMPYCLSFVLLDDRGSVA